MIDDLITDKTAKELRNLWVDNLNLFIKGQNDLDFIDELANQLFTDISIGNPKVDDVFFASLEYFVDYNEFKNRVKLNQVKNDVNNFLKRLK